MMSNFKRYWFLTLLICGLTLLAATSALGQTATKYIETGQVWHYIDGSIGVEGPASGVTIVFGEIGTTNARVFSVFQTPDHKNRYMVCLDSATAPVSDYEIVGLWDVYRNGELILDDCSGSIYGLGFFSPGDYFKIWIANPDGTWGFHNASYATSYRVF